LLKKDVKPEHFTEESIRDPKVHDFMKLIQLAELPGADLYTTRLEVKMKDGKLLSESTQAPKGDPKNPMSKQNILDKFWYNIEFSRTVSKKNAQKLLDLIENLEGLDSVKEIVELLVVK
jgi:2-methylcitrate dehydratase